MIKNSFVVFVVSLLGLLSCTNKEGQYQNFEITVVDSKGNEIAINKPVEKIVVLFEPLLDAVYMLQAEEKLVGVSSKLYNNDDTFAYLSLIDDRVKNKQIITPGDEESLNIESIIGIKPDLVIGYNIPESTVENLKNMGISVYIGKSETYADVEKEMTDLGILLGKEERSKVLLQYVNKELAKIQENIKNITPKTAYFSWANGRIFTTAGTESMMGKCLEFAGVKNVVTSAIDMPNINPELLVSWNPDVIYMWNDSPNLFYERQQLKDINAIKNKEIYNLMPMFFYNPHNLKALLTSTQIQNWAYKLISEKEMKELLKNHLTVLYGEDKGEVLYWSLINYEK